MIINKKILENFDKKSEATGKMIGELPHNHIIYWGGYGRFMKTIPNYKLVGRCEELLNKKVKFLYRTDNNESFYLYTLKEDGKTPDKLIRISNHGSATNFKNKDTKNYDNILRYNYNKSCHGTLEINKNKEAKIREVKNHKYNYQIAILKDIKLK